MEKNYFLHESSYVDDDVEIGEASCSILATERLMAP